MSPVVRRLGLVGMIVVVLLPLVPVVVWAVAGAYRYPDLLPSSVGDRGLRLVLGPRVLDALLTSVLISTAVALLACLVGLPAGRALGRHTFRGRRLVQLLLLAPVVVPPLAVTLGLQVFFIRYGLSDTPLGVVLVQLMPTVPYAALLLSAAFSSLDPDLERQARALGAGPWRTGTSVVWPLLRPALVTTFLLTFLISWSEYVLTLLIGGGPGHDAAAAALRGHRVRRSDGGRRARPAGRAAAGGAHRARQPAGGRPRRRDRGSGPWLTRPAWRRGRWRCASARCRRCATSTSRSSPGPSPRCWARRGAARARPSPCSPVCCHPTPVTWCSTASPCWARPPSGDRSRWCCRSRCSSPT